MSEVLKVVFGPIQPFVGHPGRACLVAVLFAVLFGVSFVRTRSLKLRQILIAVTAAAWAAFALQETIAFANGWDIRVDLLVTAPVVLALTVAGFWCAIRSVFSERLQDTAPAQAE